MANETTKRHLQVELFVFCHCFTDFPEADPTPKKKRGFVLEYLGLGFIVIFIVNLPRLFLVFLGVLFDVFGPIVPVKFQRFIGFKVEMLLQRLIGILLYR